ncbi:uncharacterized protein LOC143305633 [Osmia lignaria lignaria]|uniref:uncharacterized protein LOC143305633 n=1 Tax=Osmia lignaria lignaria TaxID=1437193 RepID=UPI00402B5F6C
MMALSRFVHGIEISLDHYIKTAETYLAVIRAVKSGEVPHELLDRSISRRIISDIRNTQRNFDLPIPPGHQSLKELTGSTTVNAIIYQGRIIIVLQLPLSDGTTYHLYRTYSWPIPQRLGQDTTASGYIQPKSPYLAISNDHRFYFEADESYINNCHKTPYTHLCPLGRPLSEIASSTACEVTLLLRPTTHAFKTCEVRLQPQHTPFWAHLRTMQAWLYSLEKPESVQLICNGMKDDIITIEGTGIFQLRAGCIAKTTHETLIGMQHLESLEQYFYQPNLLLNISEFSPQIHRYKEIKPLTMPSKASGVSTPIDDSLTDIEAKLAEMDTHHRSRNLTTNVLHGGLAYLAILTIAILVYCTRHTTKKIWITKTCQKRRTEPENQSTPPEQPPTTTPPSIAQQPLPPLPQQRALVN